MIDTNLPIGELVAVVLDDGHWIMGCWPSIQAWKIGWDGAPVQNSPKDLPLDRPSDFGHAFARWVQSIPVEVRLHVIQFDHSRFSMLCFLSEYGSEGLELSKYNAALSLIVARSDELGFPEARKVLEVALKHEPNPEVSVLKYLGFCDPENSARLLSCMPIRDLHISSVKKIIALLTLDKELRLLRELPRITEAVLWFVREREFRDEISNSLVVEVAAHDGSTARAVRRLIELNDRSSNPADAPIYSSIDDVISHMVERIVGPEQDLYTMAVALPRLWKEEKQTTADAVQQLLSDWVLRRSRAKFS